MLDPRWPRAHLNLSPTRRCGYGLLQAHRLTYGDELRGVFDVKFDYLKGLVPARCY